jgi:hypothetical protein
LALGWSCLGADNNDLVSGLYSMEG